MSGVFLFFLMVISIRHLVNSRHANDNQPDIHLQQHRHPRESGDPYIVTVVAFLRMDPRLRGDDG